MPTPGTTATPGAASAAADDIVRIAAENSRRTSDNAKAALQAGRRFFDQAVQLNRDLLSVWSATTEVGLQTTFDLQNAAFANGQAWLEASTNLSKDAFNRYAELTRQAQATAIKSFQAGAKFVDSIVIE